MVFLWQNPMALSHGTRSGALQTAFKGLLKVLDVCDVSTCDFFRRACVETEMGDFMVISWENHRKIIGEWW